MNTTNETCPICGGKLEANSFATSRKDNETVICNKCEQKEAIDEFLDEAKN